jgi:hypothetical protein
MTRNYYFTTIDGHPGRFTEEGLIAFCKRHGGFIKPMRTMSAVKRQIEQSKRWDMKNHMGPYDYGIMRIEM